MLSFFKSNNPAVVIFYIFYLVLFRVCFYAGGADTFVEFAHKEPLSNLVFSGLKNYSSNYQLISLLLSATLCFIQALLINYIANENKILPRKNYLAGLLYIIFSSFFKESLLLTPAGIATTFIILCTGRIFALVKKEKSYGDVFDTGFLIALATLFYFPCALLILFVYIGLATVRAFSYREWIIALLGFLAPFFLLLTWYYWNDITPQMLADVANVQPGRWFVIPSFNLSDKAMLGVLAVSAAFSLLLLPGALYSSLIQVRKFANTLVVLMVVALLAGLLQQTVHTSHLVIWALPLAIITALELMQTKRGWIPEVIHLILILLVLAGQFLPFIIAL